MLEFINELTGKVIVKILKRGEDVYKAIEDAAKKHDIDAAVFNMIGAVSKAIIGYFDEDSKEYKKTIFEKDMELVSCMGNISRKEDGSIVVHAHIAIADEKGHVYGGHLFQGTLAGATGELFILPLKNRIIRKIDDKTGLFLIKEQK
ncbi:MAG: PPC domain-containing DNA-binding protein [Candidatus Asgardarchaeia archaeon]